MAVKKVAWMCRLVNLTCNSVLVVFVYFAIGGCGSADDSAGLIDSDRGQGTATPVSADETPALSAAGREYAAAALRIASDGGDTINAIAGLQSGAGFSDNDAVRTMADELLALAEEARTLEPPGEFSAAQALLLQAFDKMEEAAGLLITYTDTQDPDAFEQSGAVASEAVLILENAAEAITATASGDGGAEQN